MDGFPVTIRTLDPPLHEFLPRREDLMVEIAVLEATKPKAPKLKELRTLLRRVEELHEINPMLGHRGCRLGITYPEITEMQARAIFEAAVAVATDGVKVHPEVMIPLTATLKEMANQAAIVNRVAKEVFEEKGQKVDYMVGTMIELPRAALVADDIAKEAQFFSFGTNDLTQTTFGFSRDDVNKVLPTYLAEGILKQDPFAVLDREGVGQLVKMATERGRKTRPDLKVGICGEHGGEPSSVGSATRLVEHVSCSPFRCSRLVWPQRRRRPARSSKSRAAGRSRKIVARRGSYVVRSRSSALGCYRPWRADITSARPALLGDPQSDLTSGCRTFPRFLAGWVLILLLHPG